MRGPIGSDIEITIRRVGEKKSFIFKIKREWLIEFVKDIENLLKEKKNVVIVSSGALEIAIWPL